MPSSALSKRCHYLAWCSMVLICCALTLSGCGFSAESDEDEHLEHFVPAHKPKNFANLVDQLALRAPQLKSSTQAGTSDEAGHATALQECSDIIDWIPELAADSELKKADFESAVATGNRLAAAFSDIHGDPQTMTVDAESLEPLIDELRKLVPKSQDRKEQI